MRNAGEARVALAHAQRLIEHGVPASAIGIITPYAAQVALLRSMRPAELGQSLEIATVDAFQGHEKEAIIFSAVRSSPAQQGNRDGTSANKLGFLCDPRRANVAITRASRHCTLVGDSATLRRDPFLTRLLDHFTEHGVVKSAHK